MKKRLIFIFIGILFAIGIVSVISNINDSEPMSAEGMAVEERNNNDTRVLIEELSDFDIDRVEINYSSDAIKVYINRPSSEQYIDNYANEILSTIITTIDTRKSDLTLEKESYNILIYSEDGKLIN